MQWLYSGRIVSKGEVGDEDSTIKHHYPEYHLLCKAHVLGDMLQDDHFQDACLDARMERAKACDQTDPQLPLHCYNSSRQDSPYKAIALDYVVWKLSKAQLEKCLNQEDVLPEFLVKVALRLKDEMDSKGPKGEFPYWKNPCRYHLHTQSGKPCYRKIRHLD